MDHSPSTLTNTGLPGLVPRPAWAGSWVITAAVFDLVLPGRSKIVSISRGPCRTVIGEGA